MNTRRLISLAGVLVALAGSLRVAAAEMVTEVLTAGFRDAGELVEVLRPLVAQPGSISAFHGQIVVRTTPEALAEIKVLLQTLDKAPASLLITVRHELDEEIRRDLAEATGTVRSGDVTVSTGRPARGRTGLTVTTETDGDATAGVRVLRTRRSDSSRDSQRLRVLEGKEAFIQTGQAVPLASESVSTTAGGVTTFRQGVEYRDVTSGFFVRARLAGDSVRLEISPNRDTLSARGGGAVETRRSATSLIGRLGRWIEVSSTGQSTSRSRTRILGSSTGARSEEYAVYVKVDRAP